MRGSPGSFVRAAAVLAGAALLPSPAVRAEEPPAAPAKVSLEERVDRAIDAGVAWLRRRGGETPDWGQVGGDVNYEGGAEIYRYPEGCTALALLTLLKCGVPPDDPQVVAGFARIGKRQRISEYNYDLCVLLLALEAQSNPWKRMRARERAGGGDAPPGRRPREEKRRVKDLPWISEIAERLQGNRRDDLAWRYGHPAVDQSPAMRGNKDLSNTVFVVMALYTATTVGVKVSDRVFADAARWVLDTQEKEGPKHPRWEPKTVRDEGYAPVMDRARGWAYLPGSTDEQEAHPTGSMTGAAVTTLLLCRRALEASKSRLWTKELEARTETAIADGLAWLDLHWSVSMNPGGIHQTIFHLYGLERIGDLMGVHLIGGHDWYREGATWLVDEQRPDGSWFGDTHTPQDLITTCFALLFLDRATLAIATESGK